MRTQSEVNRVLALGQRGLNACEIARVTGIPRGTVWDWLSGHQPGIRNRRRSPCLRCDRREGPFPEITHRAYTYLLGIYLGDGCLLRHARTYRLNVTLDAIYPVTVREVEAAVSLVMPRRKAAARPKPGERSVEINCYSKHWPCLFPQHGPGVKHARPIALEPRQREICDRFPHRLLRGLIQSDGSRHMNTIRHPNKTYAYPRYEFSNRSDDIRGIFCEYCDKVGIEWRPTNRWNISVARRPSVARMDTFVGPKR